MSQERKEYKTSGGKDLTKSPEQIEREQKKYEKDIEKMRNITKKENPNRVEEDSEYFIIYTPEKTRYIPKWQQVPVTISVEKEDEIIEHIEYVNADIVSHAIAQFPNCSLSEAVMNYRKYCREHPEEK